MAKVVLITGCSTGLGRALAEELAAQKDARSGEPRFKVFATARKPQSLQGLPPQVEALALDVTDEKSVAAAVKKVIEAAGKIDIVVNNAGMSRVGPLLEQPMSQVEEVMDANFYGVLRMIQAVVPGMVERRSGLVVNIGSVVAWMSTPFGGAYCASKAAVLSISQVLRLELSPFNVEVTNVTAGAIKSSFGTNASAVGTEMYESPRSAYHHFAAAIKARAMASQDPTTSISAEQTAQQIVRVIERSTVVAGPGSWLARLPVLGLVPGWGPVPGWFLAGGKATMFFVMGLAQRTFGWPVEGILAKAFGLRKLD